MHVMRLVLRVMLMHQPTWLTLMLPKLRQVYILHVQKAEKQKGAFRAPFYIGGSCRITWLCLVLRTVADATLSRLRSTRTCCRFAFFTVYTVLRFKVVGRAGFEPATN